jgi:hypothetical protein
MRRQNQPGCRDQYLLDIIDLTVPLTLPSWSGSYHLATANKVAAVREPTAPGA